MFESRIGLRACALAASVASAVSGGYSASKDGEHSTLFDPTASLAATVQVQKQTVKFAATAAAPGGPFVVIEDVTVLDLD